MIESNVDDALAQLGTVPENVSAIVSRTLGDTLLTLPHVDELLASLGGGLVAALGGRGAAESVHTAPTASSATHALDSPSMPIAVAAVVGVAPLDDRPLIESPAPFEPIVTPLPTPGPTPIPQLTAAERRRAEFAAAMIDSTPAGPPESASQADSDIDDVLASDRSLAFEGDTDLSEPPPRVSSGAPPAERRLEGEATAQAIVAAFDDPELDAAVSSRRSSVDDPRITLESSPAAPMELPSSLPPFDSGRRFGRGSRRPDLDRLLDQPLDALDFERSEPTTGSASRVAPQASEAPTAASPEGGSDDFEILVDDEILEIAEDEVELMDEDPSS